MKSKTELLKRFHELRDELLAFYEEVDAVSDAAFTSYGNDGSGLCNLNTCVDEALRTLSEWTARNDKDFEREYDELFKQVENPWDWESDEDDLSDEELEALYRPWKAERWE